MQRSLTFRNWPLSAHPLPFALHRKCVACRRREDQELLNGISDARVLEQAAFGQTLRAGWVGHSLCPLLILSEKTCSGIMISGSQSQQFLILLQQLTHLTCTCASMRWPCKRNRKWWRFESIFGRSLSICLTTDKCLSMARKFDYSTSNICFFRLWSASQGQRRLFHVLDRDVFVV